MKTRPQIYIKNIGYINLVIGIIVFCSWVLNIDFFLYFFSSEASMKSLTAIMFFILGVIHIKPKLIPWGGSFILFTALVIILEYLSGQSFHIDQIFTKDFLSVSSPPGRPSLATSILFALTSLILLSLKAFPSNTKFVQYFNQILIIFIIVVSFVSLVSFIFHIDLYHRIASIQTMAFHTSFLFIINAIAIAFYQPKFGLSDLIFSKRIGDVMFRKIYPVKIIVLLLFGYAAIYMYRHVAYHIETTIVLLLCIYIVISGGIVWVTATVLNHINNKRLDAIKEVEKLNFKLNKTIKDLKTTNINQEKLVQDLELKNKKLITLTHTISHDLRSPAKNLNALLAFYEESTTDHEKREIIKNIRLLGLNLNETLDELLERLKVNTENIETENINFQEILAKTKTYFTAQIIESQAIIKHEFTVPEINYPKQHLESIFVNLLSNALKYRSPDRKLELQINAYIENGHTFIKFKDNGIGIDLKKFGNKLFKLYGKINNNKDANGIGLFILKTQIEANGGKINLYSTPNQGTEFVIQLN